VDCYDALFFAFANEHTGSRRPINFEIQHAKVLQTHNQTTTKNGSTKTIIMPTATRSRRTPSAIPAPMPKKNGKQAFAKTANTEKSGKPDAFVKVAVAAESDSSQYVDLLQVLSKENGPKTGKVCKGKCYTMLLIAVC
jgi:hypothetical protein